MVINFKWPLNTEKKLQTYVFLVVLLFYSPYLCNIDKNLLYSSQTSEFCHTHTPPHSALQNHSAGNLRQSDFCFHRETKAIKRTPSNSCHQNNNTNLSMSESSFLPSCFRGRSALPLMASQVPHSILYLQTVSLYWLLPISLPTFPSYVLVPSLFPFISQPTIFCLLVPTNLSLSDHH